MKFPLVSWMVGYMPDDKRFHEPGFNFADETVFVFFSLHLVAGDPASALSEPSTVVLSESISRTYFGS
jgi:putative ABC transport system permease protein